jgi:hypothetical protein
VASSALRSSAAIKTEKSYCEITCGLDIDTMCRRNGSVAWLGCRIGGIGSDWKPGPCSSCNHRLCVGGHVARDAGSS